MWVSSYGAVGARWAAGANPSAARSSTPGSRVNLQDNLPFHLKFWRCRDSNYRHASKSTEKHSSYFQTSWYLAEVKFPFRVLHNLKEDPTDKWFLLSTGIPQCFKCREWKCSQDLCILLIYLKTKNKVWGRILVKEQMFPQNCGQLISDGKKTKIDPRGQMNLKQI